MTKCIVPNEAKAGMKPIAFKSWIDIKSEYFMKSYKKPSEFENIELIAKGENGKLDVMLTYDDGKRSSGSFYLGHWNDGIVE